MLDRIAFRSTFWAALTVIALLAGISAIEAAPSVAPTAAVLGGSIASFFLGAAPLATYAVAVSLVTMTATLAGWLLVRRELARRTLAETGIRDREARLHAAMHGSADGVFMLRAVRDQAHTVVDFEVLDVNARGAGILLLEPQTLVGRKASEISPLRCHGRLFADYVNALQTGATVVSELRVNKRHFATDWLWHQAVPVGDGLAVTLRDIAGAKLEEDRLRQASVTDELTDLYNRRGFLTLAEQQLKLARRQGRDLVLFFADMDKFKSVNDTFGHAEGDRSLRAVANLLKSAVRDSDIVARMGGDEFTVLAVDGDASTAASILRRINERIAIVNRRGDLAAPLSISIGHVRIKAHETSSLEELLSQADHVLYDRKAKSIRPTAKRRRANATVAAQPALEEGVTIAA